KDRKFYTDGDAGYDELVGCLTKDPEIPEQRCLAFALLHRGRAQRLAGLIHRPSDQGGHHDPSRGSGSRASDDSVARRLRRDEPDQDRPGRTEGRRDAAAGGCTDSAQGGRSGQRLPSVRTPAASPSTSPSAGSSGSPAPASVETPSTPGAPGYAGR